LEPGDARSSAQWNAAPKRERSGAKPDPRSPEGQGGNAQIKITMNKILVLFDGVCNLCNGVVQFIIKRDPQKKMLFASLQSEQGQRLLKKYQLPTTNFDSFIAIHNNRYFDRSSAALYVCKHLNGMWPLLYVCMLIPKRLRDVLYRFIAKRRYSWFGKSDTCFMPTPDLKARFLQ